MCVCDWQVFKRVETVPEGTTTNAWVEMKPTPLKAEANLESKQRTSLDLNADMMARVMVMKEQNGVEVEEEESPFETEEEAAAAEAPKKDQRTSLDMNADMMAHVMQVRRAFESHPNNPYIFRRVLGLSG